MAHQIVLFAERQTTVGANKRFEPAMDYGIVLVQISLHAEWLVATWVRANIRFLICVASQMNKKFALKVNRVLASRDGGFKVAFEQQSFFQLFIRCRLVQHVNCVIVASRLNWIRAGQKLFSVIFPWALWDFPFWVNFHVLHVLSAENLVTIFEVGIKEALDLN